MVPVLAFALVIALVAFYTIRLADARDAAVLQANRAQRSQELLLGMFTGGDDTAAPSEDLRVLELLDRGVQEADTLRGEPTVRAELFTGLVIDAASLIVAFASSRCPVRDWARSGMSVCVTNRSRSTRSCRPSGSLPARIHPAMERFQAASKSPAPRAATADQ